jgi:membrane-associated phospholipid phosphatase
VLDRPRAWILGLATATFAVFATLALMVSWDRTPLEGFDDWGRSAEDWADGSARLQQALRLIEFTFDTWAMTLWTTLLAGALAAKKHLRAAAYAVGVMVTTSLVTTLVKVTFGRARPTWQNPTGLLDGRSFPSGHASSSAAFAGILMVLALMLIRRPGLRRLAYAAAVATALLVATDRVLLGRHYPTDVGAGAALGATTSVG